MMSVLSFINCKCVTEQKKTRNHKRASYLRSISWQQLQNVGKKTAAKKAPVKKAPVKKTAAKKAPVKKAPVKKTAAKKAPVKKAPVKQSTSEGMLGATTVTVTGAGCESLVGTIVESTANFIALRVKRPRSKLFDVHTFQRSNILSLLGKESNGSSVTLLVCNLEMQLLSVRADSVELLPSGALRLTVGSNTQDVTPLPQHCVTLVSDDSGAPDVPASEPEDEEEEWDEPEEEEEEEEEWDEEEDEEEADDDEDDEDDEDWDEDEDEDDDDDDWDEEEDEEDEDGDDEDDDDWDEEDEDDDEWDM